LIVDPKGTIKGEVTLIERLGTETVVELISPEGTPFRVASPENLDLTVGDAVSFNFQTSSAHLF
jgi:multiple sugar transport system ATP-binding protein